MGSAINILKDLDKARRELAPGHVRISELAAKLDSEYLACREQEKLFLKRLGKRWNNSFASYQEAADFSASLTSALGVRAIKLIAPKEPDMPVRVNAYYRPERRSIYIGGCYQGKVWGLNPRAILHETAHHIQFQEHMYKGGEHGADFLDIERLMFEYLLP